MDNSLHHHNQRSSSFKSVVTSKNAAYKMSRSNERGGDTNGHTTPRQKRNLYSCTVRIVLYLSLLLLLVYRVTLLISIYCTSSQTG